MLTLAQAVQEGPWQLPPRVRAEAAQQEARGHAMLRDDLEIIGPKLDEARALLAQDKQGSGLAAHYDEALFMLQVAICHCESGQPAHAIELYDIWLSRRTFSRRDYGYFLSLKGQAYAVAQEPDEASKAGVHALTLARSTNSARTIQEVSRLLSMLQRWQERESVRELRETVLA
jgi:tetratricopeptide (TPR) repeat protein